MKAVIWTKYGSPDLLEYTEIEKPNPKDDEILVKIYAATVTAGDCELRRFDLAPWIWLPVRLYVGIRKPRIKLLGQELAGEIESVGKNVTELKKGDQIFAEVGMTGAYKEYTCLSANKRVISIKPKNMSFEEAATIPTGGINALHFLRKGNISAGQQVLINGAGGSIGTYAVQIAKSYGAEVTCVDSTRKLDMLTDIGADYVIDYTKNDFTKNGQTYDLIIDVVGTSSYARSIKSLNKNGHYVLGNPRFLGMIRGLWTSMTSTKKVISQLASPKIGDFLFLKELIEEGKLKSVIDKRYSLKQVAEAHHYVEKGHKTGNVVININS
ncbi:NAD(P)-dependent alcohol dehydrogenase [Aquimarina sp. 2201CG5-10]|uniref:NAD(P)-dependent alcohol dehydrogenase n=1 Tax=Aquimarina callyspongiae TaxID=3098150 RepID=UPI002AB567D0|nr:NAD(P)-dependent alcohol dehydrogenase [Aquimarina sp. 2201CG5-10]MDY8135644.1 NAD(P)-dependent alcohol dehydrogenase [Aquimarina sp. 2201CG5-10]